MRFASLLIVLPLLAACQAKADREKSEVTIGKTVTVTDDGEKSVVTTSSGDHGFGIDTDKFKLALDIPGMSLHGGSLDIDGMKLFPGSEVRGMKVASHEKDGDKDSKVTVTFTSPATPAAVLDHAVKQAEDDGWTVARSGNTLSGTKEERSFAYALSPNGTKTDGTLTVTGDNE